MAVPTRDDLDRNVAQPPAETLAFRMEAALIERISGPRFQMWFHDHAKFVSAGRELLVAVANHQFQEWLELTFGDAVRAAASSVYGRATPVRHEPGNSGHDLGLSCARRLVGRVVAAI